MSIDWSNITSLISSWGVIFPLIIFLVSLSLVPMILVSLPHNYFNEASRQIRKQDGGTARHVLIILVKNICGVALIVVGIIMLVLPGQGLLTVLAGLMLTNFPGKYRLERWLVRRAVIRKSINWVRARANRAPMTFD